MCASRTVEKEEKQAGKTRLKTSSIFKNATLGSIKLDKIEMWTKLKKAKKMKMGAKITENVDL